MENNSETSEPMSIPIGVGMRAFATGIQVGQDALAHVEGAANGQPVSARERAAMYWLTCGMNFAVKFPEATDEMQTGFIAGAASRAPSAPDVEVIIQDTENAAFEEDATDEIARIIRVAAERIEHGYQDGALLDSNGNTVGSFRISN